MSVTERFDRHERLFRRMAQRNGADLDLALMVGATTDAELAEATHACMGCTGPARCEALIDADVPGLPSFCRNKDMIRELAEVLNSA